MWPYLDSETDQNIEHLLVINQWRSQGQRGQLPPPPTVSLQRGRSVINYTVLIFDWGTHAAELFSIPLLSIPRCRGPAAFVGIHLLVLKHLLVGIH